jgi:hypothetical protein
MAATVRLPTELQAEAMAYAERLGLSLNGLIAVALRDYLDGRRRAPLEPAATPPVEAVQASPEPAPQPQRLGGKPAPELSITPPAKRHHACPCGSGKRYDKCHGRQAQP